VHNFTKKVGNIQLLSFCQEPLIERNKWTYSKRAYFTFKEARFTSQYWLNLFWIEGHMHYIFINIQWIFWIIICLQWNVCSSKCGGLFNCCKLCV